MGNRTRNPAAQTAFWPMALTAIEQHEPPERRFVDDDLAASFLPTTYRWMVATTRLPPLRRLLIRALERSGPGLWANLTCRKRYIDDQLDHALDTVDAVVILGAGMDTRGYRLARRSEIPVFEVDQPINIDRKAKVVRRVLGGIPPSVRLVALDFERDDLLAVLAEHGYRRQDRTFFVWEGVTQVLPPGAVHATFEQLRGAAPGSRLVFTYVRRDFIEGANLYGTKVLYRRVRQKRQLWHFGVQTEEVSALLGSYGWRLIEQAGPAYFVSNYIEPTGRRPAASALEWSVYAEKR